MRNPDFTPDANGVFHVSGDLMVQFQVIGPEADKVEAFGLSFGVDIPTGEEVCALPPQAWTTGVYLESYKLDKTKEDGFFVGISSNAASSPQMELGVAVHAYDADGFEVARFWGQVNLDHCGQQPTMGCPDDELAPDFTMPWMKILPGDGSLDPVNGIAIEFNEELESIIVELNGEDITDELEEWLDRPVYDSDTVPAGPQQAWERVMPQCEGPEIDQVHTCGPLGGPAYQWTNRQMTDEDIIRVIATDLAGNVATKEIHIGSSVAGGAISDGIPILQMTFEQSRLQAAPGETAVYKMIMNNAGGGEGHPFADAIVPEGWIFEWIPGHKPVPAGGTSEQELHVTVPVDVVDDTYVIEPVINYQQGQDDKTLRSLLNLEVITPEGQEVDSVEEEAPKKSPGTGILAIGMLLAAFVAMRRR